MQHPQTLKVLWINGVQRSHTCLVEIDRHTEEIHPPSYSTFGISPLRSFFERRASQLTKGRVIHDPTFEVDVVLSKYRIKVLVHVDHNNSSTTVCTSIVLYFASIL